MPILQQITAIASSAARYWFSPSVNSYNNAVDSLSGYASDASFSDETLSYGQQTKTGQQTFGPDDLGSVSVPGTDPATGVSFDTINDALELSPSTNAALFSTSATPDFDASDRTVLTFAPFDDEGNALQEPKTLVFNGQSSIKDLYQLDTGTRADFGNSFVVTYSTWDPQSGQSRIAYTIFDEAGDPSSSGTLRSFSDGSHHGLDFGSFYTAYNPNNDGQPDYIFMNRISSSNALIQVELLDTDMQKITEKNLSVSGPNGETSSRLDHYNYLAPGTGTADNYGAVSATFKYTDSAGKSHEEIEIETIDPTSLQVQARTWFPDLAGTQSNAILEHLDNGNLLAFYNDGGHTQVKEFTSDLQQVGQTFALPQDNYGFDSIAALGNDTFRIDWRNKPGSGASPTVEHHALFHA